MIHGARSDCLVPDLSRLLPGPYCPMIPADHGVRVIAAENRRFAAEAIPLLHLINRNKTRMPLNLKTGRGGRYFMHWPGRPMWFWRDSDEAIRHMEKDGVI